MHAAGVASALGPFGSTSGKVVWAFELDASASKVSADSVEMRKSMVMCSEMNGWEVRSMTVSSCGFAADEQRQWGEEEDAIQHLRESQFQ
jgi:hypothetical protein